MQAMRELVTPLKRKNSQHGTTRKRGKGWTAIYRVGGKQFWEGGFATKADAQKRLNAVLGAVDEERFIVPTERTLRDFAAQVQREAKLTVKPSTWMVRETNFNKWILPALGDRTISSIQKADVLAFIDQMKAARLSSTSMHHLLVHLRRTFNQAIKAKHAAKNPTDDVTIKKNTAERYVPTVAEVKATYSHLAPVHKVFMATAFLTGLRRGELCGLQWGDINFEKGVIHVQRAVQRVNRKLLDENGFLDVQRIQGTRCLALTTLKSKKSKRKVKMALELAALLRTLKSKRFVFEDGRGRPFDPDQCLDPIRDAQIKAGVSRFGLHGLRHLYATELHEAGGSVRHVQGRLGHSDIATTLIYLEDAREGAEYASTVAAKFLLADVSKPEFGASLQQHVN